MLRPLAMSLAWLWLAGPGMALGGETPPAPAAGAAELPAPARAISIARVAGAIAIDGDLADAPWQGLPWIETFWETNHGDNVPPPARTRARLAYDDRFLYAAFEFDDPEPGKIRAPLGDHDNVSGDTDYGGIIVDARGEGRTALMFLANPRGVQYDAISNDASGEDSSLDLYWDAAARLTPEGWRLEIRVPFSSLRYDGDGAPAWRILLYRNYPRDFRYQVFSSRLPRGSNCFICHSRPLVGLAGLPGGGHLVAAPYATGRQAEVPDAGLGSPLAREDAQGEAGLDLKWTPNADNAVDLTVNPDFSQIESDVPQIEANERFALFFPEKRPFFLEGLDLFATPLQAVHTRTITDPSWGARATGQLAGTAYTVLLTEDRGGGSVVLPGPEGSRLVDQNLSSRVLIGRLRRDLGGEGLPVDGTGRAFGSFLVTAREMEDGSYNRVVGPDFEWRPSDGDRVSGQLLWSETETPNQPGLAPEWDGRRLSSHALDLQWDRASKSWSWFAEHKDLGDDFRADVGFLPQVGYRETVYELRRELYPKHGIFHRIRPLVAVRYGTEQDGSLLLRRLVPGVILEGKWDSYAEIRYKSERVRAEGQLFSQDYLSWYFQASPSRTIGRMTFEGNLGDRVDFDNLRLGRGGNVEVSSILRPGAHLELRFDGGWSYLDLPRQERGGGRLFDARTLRLKATYTFTARSFLRLIGQRTETERDLALYTFPVAAREEDFTGSALFAYKLNWQTVLFLGYGDERGLSPLGSLEPARREVFFKVAYAVQR